MQTVLTGGLIQSEPEPKKMSKGGKKMRTRKRLSKEGIRRVRQCLVSQLQKS